MPVSQENLPDTRKKSKLVTNVILLSTYTAKRRFLKKVKNSKAKKLTLRKMCLHCF